MNWIKPHCRSFVRLLTLMVYISTFPHYDGLRSLFNKEHTVCLSLPNYKFGSGKWRWKSTPHCLFLHTEQVSGGLRRRWKLNCGERLDSVKQWIPVIKTVSHFNMLPKGDTTLLLVLSLFLSLSLAPPHSLCLSLSHSLPPRENDLQ